MFLAVPSIAIYIYAENDCSSVHISFALRFLSSRVIRHTISAIPSFFGGEISAFRRKHFLNHSQLDLSVTVNFSRVSYPVPPNSILVVASDKKNSAKRTAV